MNIRDLIIYNKTISKREAKCVALSIGIYPPSKKKRSFHSVGRRNSNQISY